MMIWQYAKQEAKGLIPPLSNAKKAKIKKALIETVEVSTSRSRAGAIALIKLLDQKRWSDPLRIHLGGGGIPKGRVGVDKYRAGKMQERVEGDH